MQSAMSFRMAGNRLLSGLIIFIIRFYVGYIHDSTSYIMR